jgi:hypothetical protein
MYVYIQLGFAINFQYKKYCCNVRFLSIAWLIIKL